MAIELLLQLVLGPLGAGLRFNAGDGGGRRLWEGKEERWAISNLERWFIFGRQMLVLPLKLQ